MSSEIVRGEAAIKEFCKSQEPEPTYRVVSNRGRPLTYGANNFKKLRKEAKRSAKKIKRTAKLMFGGRLSPKDMKHLGQYVSAEIGGINPGTQEGNTL